MAIYEMNGQRYEISDEVQGDQLTETLTLLSEGSQGAPTIGPVSFGEKPKEALGELSLQDAGIQGKIAEFKEQGFPEAEASRMALSPPPSPDSMKTAMQGIPETALNLVSGAVAEPIAGIAGLAALPSKGAEAGSVVDSVRDALTIDPRTESGKATSQALGETLSPILSPITKATDAAADFTLDKTGSPALAAAVKSLPTAVVEAVGTKGLLRNIAKRNESLLKEPSAKEVRESVAEAAPSAKQLREASRKIYDTVKELGVTVSPESYGGFLRKTIKEALDQGLDAPSAGNSLTPQSATVLNRMQSLLDEGDVSVEALEKVRRSAQNAASVASRSGNNADAAVNNLIVDNVDEYLSKLDVKDFTGDGKNIGRELGVARRLWGKARKAELLDEAATEAAKDQASGFENGLRIQFRQILNNKKKRRYFSENELGAIRQVVRGTPGANMFKRLGKLGFGRDQQTNVLGGMSAAGAGAYALHSFGPVGSAIGAVLFPTVGYISHRMAERLTRKNADFANQIVRAGSDANSITRAYLRNTPKNQRDPQELAQLLMRPDINKSVEMTTPIGKNAVQIAQDQAAATQIAAPALNQESEEEATQ